MGSEQAAVAPSLTPAPQPVLRVSFWLGAIVILGAMVLGLLYSAGRDRTLPSLQLAYYPGIAKLVEAGEYRQALDQLNVAIELDFLSRVRIHQEIAQIAMTNGQLDDHIAACRALITAGAADEVTSLNLSGSLLMRSATGDHRRAEELSRELLQKYPNHPAVNCNLGAALLGQDQLVEAEQY
ncbi:MAG: hypothetical protein VB857_02195, partial [Pirellulaceae bacterium]